MLFDLRGSGRRRTVKIVYIALAFLMGGGLVLFGIGGGGGISGGLVDAITGHQRRRRHQRGPLPQAGDGGAREDAGQPAGRGRLGRPRPRALPARGRRRRTSTPRSARSPRRATRSSRSAGDAWERYLALNPKKPDDRVASLMVQAFGALNKPDKAAEAQEVITERQTHGRRPSPSSRSSPTRPARPARATSPRTRRSSSPTRTCARRSRASSSTAKQSAASRGRRAAQRRPRSFVLHFAPAPL